MAFGSNPTATLTASQSAIDRHAFEIQVEVEQSLSFAVVEPHTFENAKKHWIQLAPPRW